MNLSITKYFKCMLHYTKIKETNPHKIFINYCFTENYDFSNLRLGMFNLFVKFKLMSTYNLDQV